MGTKPLSQKTIDIVKATAPVIAEHGVAITSTMYRNMFRDHPELRSVFNPANQAFGVEKTRASQTEAFSHQLFTDPSGTGKQQATLAQAIYAYAANIDNLEALTPAVLRIAHKHASLDIRPEQYPTVGANVLRAIKEVLGDAATDDIMAAWQEAYEVLAELFIELENQLREESAEKPGGWTGFRKFVVDKKVQEADNAYSFYLKPQDGGPLPPYKAGQYTCFRVRVPGYDWAPDHILHRNYTLSDFGGGDHYRVSIKREPGAKEYPAGLCSNYFHDEIQEGDVVEMAPPYGEFGLVKSSLPQVFIGAGIGSTAMLSLLQGALAAHLPQPLYFIQCVRNGGQHPLKGDLRAAVKTHPNLTLHVCYSQPAAEDTPGEDYDSMGRLSLSQLQKILPDNQCEFYFTGPVPFMHDLYQMLGEWGVPAARIHYECYGPFAAEVEAGG
jgi:nitric oxide dioxygenase